MVALLSNVFGDAIKPASTVLLTVPAGPVVIVPVLPVPAFTSLSFVSSAPASDHWQIRLYQPTACMPQAAPAFGTTR